MHQVNFGGIIQSERTQVIYQVVGRWGGTLVLAPIGWNREPVGDCECLLYYPGELQALIESGDFITIEEDLAQ